MALVFVKVTYALLDLQVINAEVAHSVKADPDKEIEGAQKKEGRPVWLPRLAAHQYLKIRY